MEVLTPRTLDEALALKAEHPSSVPIQGGTDVMVALNFDRLRPEVVLNLNEVAELRGWDRENGATRLGAGLTFSEAVQELGGAHPALAEASRTVGSPQIRNRGTIGGNLGTASPAGDALPPLSATVTRADLVRYAGASGDFNPIHWNERFAREVGLPDVIAHGMLTMALAGRVVTDWVGDPGAVLEYGARFTRPVVVPDDGEGATVEVTATRPLSSSGDSVVTVMTSVTAAFMVTEISVLRPMLIEMLG